MKPGFVAGMIGLWMMVLTVTAGAAPLTLVERGEPACVIVIAQEATRSAQLAAYELQWHLQQITGATVPIVTDQADVRGPRILVGPSTLTEGLGLSAKFGPQEYLIKFLPDTIVLMGNDKEDRGKVDYNPDHPTRYRTWPDPFDECATIYAVDDFLHDYCEARWYNPTDMGTVLPRRRTLRVTPGREVRRAPVYTNRFSIPYSVSEQGWGCMAEWLDGQARLWVDGTPQAKEIERLSWPDLYAKYPNGNPEEERARAMLYIYRSKLGGEKAFANHTVWGYWRRYYRPYEGEEDLFEEKRPQYFGIGYEGEPPEPCFSNEDFIAQVIADAREYFDHNTFKRGQQNWGKYFAVVPNDDNLWCKCERCQRQLRPERTEEGINAVSSDYFFRFINKVAAGVRETNPGKWIITLAYADYQGHPSFALEPNVAVDMCLSTRNWYAPAQVRADMRMLTEWSVEKGKRPLLCWVYWTFPQEVANNGKFLSFPGFFAHTAAAQFRLLRDHGITGIFYCGIGQDVENYVANRMMDNPDLDVDAILEDYFTRQYGKAGAPLREFYEAVEDTFMNSQNYPPAIASGEIMQHQNREIAWKWLGTRERMAQFAKYIEAADAAPVTSAQRARVELFKKNFWDYMVAGRQQYEDREALPLPKYTVPRVPAAKGDAKAADWTQAVTIDEFYERGTDKAAQRKLSARVVHDGEYLYLRLEDPCETAKVVTYPSIAPYDDWEIFLAKERAIPYRQVLVGPTAMIQGLTHGEVNWRMNVPWLEHGIKATSDLSAPNLWRETVAIPLSGVVAGGVKPGEAFFMSVIRVSGPALTGGGLIVDCSLSFANVHEPDRLAQFTLEK